MQICYWFQNHAYMLLVFYPCVHVLVLGIESVGHTNLIQGDETEGTHW